jgi:hypothetical protein
MEENFRINCRAARCALENVSQFGFSPHYVTENYDAGY